MPVSEILDNIRRLNLKASGLFPAVYVRHKTAFQQEKAYRVYVTDVLKILAESTAKYSGGSYMKIRYYDLIQPKPEESRTPEEIIGNMKEKIARIGGGES